MLEKLALPQELGRKLRGGALAIVSVRFIGFFLAIAISALLARVVSVSDLGTYFLMLNLAGLFSIFVHFGTPNVLLKQVSDALYHENHSAIKFILANVLTIIAISSAVFGSLVYLLKVPLFEIGLNNSHVSKYVAYLIVWAIGLALQTVSSELLRAHEKFFFAAITKSPLATLITLILVIVNHYFWEMNLGKLFIICAVSPFIVSAIAMSYIGIKTFQNINQKHSLIPSLPETCKTSAPLFIYGVGAYIGSHADVWLISLFSEPTQLGFYSASARLMILAGVTLTIANGVVPPFIAKFRNSGDSVGLEKMLQVVARVAAIPSIVVVMLFIFFSEKILSIVYGTDYSQGAEVLVILSIGQLSNVVVGSCGYVLIMYGKNKVLMTLTIFSSVVSIALSLIFIQYFEIMIAVALAFSISKVINQMLQLYCCQKHCGVNTSIFLFPSRANNL